MPDTDDELPLADPGLGPGAAPARTGPSRAGLVATALALLFLGAILGLYTQGPGVRAFFKLSGLEPGGGSRHPIALPAPAEAVTVEASPAPTEVIALGRLRPRGGVIDIAAPTTAAAPRVLEVRVAEGDEVEREQVLVVLDTFPQLQAGHTAAERSVAVAEAALVQVRRDVRSGRNESAAAVDAARATSEHAERERARTEQLHSTGSVPPAQLESAEASAKAAAAELRRAEATAARFASGADIRLAEESLEAARADLARAVAELANATVLAPTEGTVLSVQVQPGERAPTGTLLTLADLSLMEAEIEVYQDAVGRLGEGAPVRLESEVLLDGPLRGTVRRIGREVGRQTLTSSDPAANTDARVVRAWVDLDPPSTEVAARFVGLEVIAHVDVSATDAP